MGLKVRLQKLAEEIELLQSCVDFSFSRTLCYAFVSMQGIMSKTCQINKLKRH